MEIKIVIGFFVGVLCGIVPLIFGFLKNHKILGIVGIVLSAGAGALFNALEKSPFSAFIVSVLFIVIIIASNKSKKNREDHFEEDSYDN